MQYQDFNCKVENKENKIVSLLFSWAHKSYNSQSSNFLKDKQYQGFNRKVEKTVEMLCIYKIDIVGSSFHARHIVIGFVRIYIRYR